MTDDDLNDEVDPILDATNQISDDVEDGYFDKVNFVKLIGEGYNSSCISCNM